MSYLADKKGELPAGLETNARPRRVKFRPGEWFVRPDQPGGRVFFFFFFFYDYHYYLKRDDKLFKCYDVMGSNCILFEDIQVLGLFTGRQ